MRHTGTRFWPLLPVLGWCIRSGHLTPARLFAILSIRVRHRHDIAVEVLAIPMQCCLDARGVVVPVEDEMGGSVLPDCVIEFSSHKIGTFMCYLNRIDRLTSGKKDKLNQMKKA